MVKEKTSKCITSVEIYTETPLILFSGKEELAKYRDDFAKEYYEKGGLRCGFWFPDVYSGELPKELLSKIEKFDEISRENDELRKRNAFLECQPYQGPEFFNALKEEINEGNIIH